MKTVSIEKFKESYTKICDAFQIVNNLLEGKECTIEEMLQYEKAKLLIDQAKNLIL